MNPHNSLNWNRLDIDRIEPKENQIQQRKWTSKKFFEWESKDSEIEPNNFGIANGKRASNGIQTHRTLTLLRNKNKITNQKFSQSTLDNYNGCNTIGEWGSKYSFPIVLQSQMLSCKKKNIDE